MKGFCTYTLGRIFDKFWSSVGKKMNEVNNFSLIIKNEVVLNGMNLTDDEKYFPNSTEVI